MLRKAYLFLLFICLPFIATAQSETAPQHYFRLMAFLGDATFYPPALDWLEVRIAVNGQPNTVTFSRSDANGNMPKHQFPLNEIDMSKPGLIEIIDARYQDPATGAIVVIPLGDVDECSIAIKSKEGYPNSTISEAYVDASRCGSVSVYSYFEQK
jgi:hypothetical protein